MKTVRFSIGLFLFGLLMPHVSNACVECSGGWCYPALGWGYLHCSIHCPGDPNADCICYAGGGFCQGAQAPRSTSLAWLKSPRASVDSQVPQVVLVATTANDAGPQPAGYPKRELPSNCSVRETVTGGKLFECGPKIGMPAVSTFSFSADPAKLLQLAEVNKDLAYLLYRASSIQREMRLDLSGGAISAQVPQSASAVRTRILGGGTGDVLTSPIQYQFTRVGQVSEGSVRFVFTPQEPTRGVPIVVEFGLSTDAAFDFALTGWRQR